MALARYVVRQLIRSFPARPRETQRFSLVLKMVDGGVVGSTISWLCGLEFSLIIPLTKSANLPLIEDGSLLNTLISVGVGDGLVARGSRVVGGGLVAMGVEMLSLGALLSLPVKNSLIRFKTVGIDFPSTESKLLLPLRSLLSMSARVVSVFV